MAANSDSGASEGRAVPWLDTLDPVFAIPSHQGASKVMDLSQAVQRFVHRHDTVHVGYSDARPNAALLELARSFAGTDPQFTIVTAGLVNVQHTLVELGLVKKVVASFVGENYPVARPNPAFSRAFRDGTVEIEHWSLYSLIARLAAGALGVSHFPVRSMVGSTMGSEAIARGELVEVDVGVDTPLALVKALRPDIVLLHGAAADEHGNVVLAAPYGEGHWGSMASKNGVVATVERIVSTDEIRSMSRLTKIPAHVVKAVCLAPLGAHPYGFNNPGVPEISSYVEDEAFVNVCLDAARDSESFRAWIDEWVLGVASHDEYLHKLGEVRRQSLLRDQDATSWRGEADDTWVSDVDASATETQVVVTARRLFRSVQSKGHQAILAGVGLSNLAAWTAAQWLRKSGVDVELMAEIGLVGYDPRPGEPFIFAGRNVSTNKMLTDVMGVLGTLVSGPGTKSVGVIGAGQIDATGAINSTYTEDGDFIVGSGGGNDVLSAADEVIVTVSHQAKRLVSAVPYVTSPGQRVSTIVTDLCVFERGPDDQFVLAALLPAAGETDAEAIDLIRRRTGWEFAISDALTRETAPSPEELVALRAFDPGLLFLRDRKPRSAPV